jgi:hypothetical protein
MNYGGIVLVGPGPETLHIVALPLNPPVDYRLMARTRPRYLIHGIPSVVSTYPMLSRSDVNRFPSRQKVGTRNCQARLGYRL